MMALPFASLLTDSASAAGGRWRVPTRIARKRVGREVRQVEQVKKGGSMRKGVCGRSSTVKWL